MKICLLITGLYRDFEYSYNNTKSFFEFDNINYDIFFLMSETHDIEEKKTKIKEIFGNKLKYLYNIFDNEDDKIIYYDNINNLKILYYEKIEIIKQKYDNTEFYFPLHNIFEQFYKISFIQKKRKEYELTNNIIYDVIIRARPDLCIIDDNYYIHDGPHSDYKKNGKYYGASLKKSNLIKQNILTIRQLFKYIDIEKNKTFSIINKDFISINSNYAADKEIFLTENLLYIYDFFYQSTSINNIISYLNNNYSYTQYVYEENNIAYIIPISTYSSNDEYIKYMLLNCDFIQGRNLLKFLFLSSHCFCNEIEIISRYIFDTNINFFSIDYFIATSYFIGLKKYSPNNYIKNNIIEKKEI